MNKKWCAWWNGIFTVALFLLVCAFLKAVWLHNKEDIFEWGFLTFLCVVAWVGSFLEAVEE